MRVIDAQGESHRLTISNPKHKKIITFRTAERANSASNFNLFYEFRKEGRKLAFNSLYINHNNQGCDRSLASTYRMVGEDIEDNLKNINRKILPFT